jgi:hypothetical protein
VKIVFKICWIETILQEVQTHLPAGLCCCCRTAAGTPSQTVSPYQAIHRPKLHCESRVLSPRAVCLEETPFLVLR